jgi:predicted transcriptional regulator of viral defense system
MGWKIQQGTGGEEPGRQKRQRSREAWTLARRQHDVVSRQQLLALGFSRREIERRLQAGRLHRVRTGVYAVGRPTLTQHGRWMAAVLACGEGAVLSHSSAAALWRISYEKRGLIELSLPSSSDRCRPGLRIHRRSSLRSENVTLRLGIPVTTPVQTLIDLALRLDRRGIERMINEADKYDLVHPPELREALDQRQGEPASPGSATSSTAAPSGSPRRSSNAGSFHWHGRPACRFR